MLLFTTNFGRLVAVPGDGVPMSFKLEGWAGNQVMQAVLGGVGLKSECDAQFLHTLRRFVYVYTFGERMGEIAISGVAATAPPCVSDGDSRTGFERVYRYYDQFRLSARGAPVDVAIGTAIKLRMFVVSTQLGFSDLQSGLSQFTIVGRSAIFSLDGGRPAPVIPTTATVNTVVPPRRPVNNVAGARVPPAAGNAAAAKSPWAALLGLGQGLNVAPLVR